MSNKHGLNGVLVLCGLAMLAACGGGDNSGPSPMLEFAPSMGPVGTVVTITGADFSKTQSVRIGGIAAIALSQSASSLTALVMPGATSGPVSVTTATGVFTVPGTFTISATGVPATQQGAKLVGTGAVGAAEQGRSVALSADGNTAVVGGYNDNSQVGAAWVFTP